MLSVTHSESFGVSWHILVSEDKNSKSGQELTHSLDSGVSWMRAAGETTRLRLLSLLNKADLTVSDLMLILDQSQPRLSRHLKLLVEAGLAERFQEGAWAYFRTIDTGPARAFLNSILLPLEQDGDVLVADNEKLNSVLEARTQRASDYFAKNAEQWGKIRSFHVAEDRVEDTMLELGLDASPRSLLDLGTGTGRILQLFAPHIERGVGVDMSHDMLAVARAALSGADYEHVQIRHGDLYRLGDGERFDLVILHQVLHYLEDPGLVLRHAKRRLTQQGIVMIVDFAPHQLEFLRDEHAHRRLGIGTDLIQRWFSLAGLALKDERLLKPDSSSGDDLTVAIWTAEHADDEH